jgi:hypothetical protein
MTAVDTTFKPATAASSCAAGRGEVSHQLPGVTDSLPVAGLLEHGLGSFEVPVHLVV